MECMRIILNSNLGFARELVAFLSGGKVTIKATTQDGSKVFAVCTVTVE